MIASFDIGLVNFAFAIVNADRDPWRVEAWVLENVHGKTMVASMLKLESLLLAHVSALQSVRKIVIEQQRGATQRCVATFVWSFCRYHGCVTPTFVRPYSPPFPTTYRQRKSLAVAWVEEQRDKHIPPEFWSMFVAAKKKDDLADCLRQAVFKL